MKKGLRLYILLLVFIAITILPSACNLVLDLSFTEKIIVEYKLCDEYLKFEITDPADIDAIISACRDSMRYGEGNCEYTVVKLTFQGGKKEVVLLTDGGSCDTMKYGDREEYFSIGSENMAKLISILKKYGASFDYLGTDNATFSTTVYVEDKIINVNLPIEKYNRTFEDVELYTLSEADKNIEEVVAEVLDSTKITKTESSSTNLDIISYSDGTNTVMYDTGDFGIRVVMDGKYVSSDKISLSAQEAWESTKQFIIEKKLLTEKELLELAVEIIPITAQKIDVNSEDTNNDSGPAFTTDYLIKMRRQIDGIPVSITASGVKATISDEGVYWLSKEWNEMIPTGKMVEILSVDEILTSMQTELVNMRDDLENITITDISLIYFPSTTSENCTELIPAWECTYANGTLIFDACSGKLIGQ